MFTVVCLALTATMATRRLRRRNDAIEATGTKVAATVAQPVHLVEHAS